MIGYECTQAELAFVRKAYDECSAFITICGGMMVPLQAGILEGKTATAPRFFIPSLHKMAVGTNWIDRRYARDGKLWTSGALLNGLDLMTAFTKSTWGDRGVINFQIKLGGWPDRGEMYTEAD
jgi:transcriptional regulator GlxA family with amidase domain